MAVLDVIVVGGGPAGSTSAEILKKHGYNVELIEKEIFPRFKPCAGWITEGVLELAGIEPEEYSSSNTLQRITGFLLWDRKGRAHVIDYGKTVSYGIIRTEFDDFLLKRAINAYGLKVHFGTYVRSIHQKQDRVTVTTSRGTIEARVVIGAGGHFCPVSKALGNTTSDDFTVATLESETLLDPGVMKRFTLKGEIPEIRFLSPISGYAWYIVKGNYLTIGVGSVDKKRIRSYLSRYMDFLEEKGNIPKGWKEIIAPFKGHFYKFYPASPRRIIGNRLLLAGDSAGFAYNMSGEGIKPAIISGILAARTVMEAGGDYSEKGLSLYRRYAERFFGVPGKPPTGERGTGRKVSTLANIAFERILLGTGPGRKFIVERFFLGRNRYGKQDYRWLLDSRDGNYAEKSGNEQRHGEK